MSPEQSVLDLGIKRARELKLRWISYPELIAMPEVEGRYCGAYRADDVHALLGAGEELFAQLPERGGALWSQYRAGVDTHTALLIGIRPIAQPTREEQALELLREVVDRVDHGWGAVGAGTLVERAKALLAKERSK